MLIDDITDRVVENQQLSIDADHRAVLHRADLLFDRFNDVQLFVTSLDKGTQPFVVCDG